MSKLYKQLDVDLTDYVIACRRHTFYTFTEVLIYNNDKINTEPYNSFNIMHALMFKTRKNAEKYLHTLCIEDIQKIRESLGNKNYSGTEITKDIISNYSDRHYRIMTLDKLCNDPNRWKEECHQTEKIRMKINNEIKGK